MQKPILNTGGAVRSPIKAFYGINRKKYGSPGECVNCLNINGDEFPVMRSVKGNKSVLTSEKDITKLLPPDEGKKIELIGLVGGEITGVYGFPNEGEQAEDTRRESILEIDNTIVVLPSLTSYNKTTQKYRNRTRDMYSYEKTVGNSNLKGIGGANGEYYIYLDAGRGTQNKDNFINKKIAWISMLIEKKYLGIWDDSEKDSHMIITECKEHTGYDCDYLCVSYYKKDENGEYQLSPNQMLDEMKTKFSKDDYARPYSTFSEIRIVFEEDDIKIACVHQNRVWGVSCDGRKVMCSKLGEPTEFTTYDAGASSSWFCEVGSEGSFTGIIPYNNAIFAFKASSVHVVYGTVPQNYSMEKTFEECGCIDGNSIIVVNNALYWLGYNGIYRYTGGTPKVISENLNKRYKKCVSFSDNQKLYLNLTDYDGNSELLCYDTLKGLWHSLSYFDFLGGFLFDGKLYAYTSREVYEISGGDYGEWGFESVLEYNATFDNHSATEIFLRAEMKKGSKIKVEHKGISQVDWENCGEYTADCDCMIKEKFVSRFKNDKAYQYKISGNGEVYIYELERTTPTGGRKNF